mmetsp:Transcript_13327/g.21853  ORF Transcript_13327/g.21853 Transcript_13327/m.21853 type:complete len:1077 (-) Transcript_13327:386-3616(-)
MLRFPAVALQLQPIRSRCYVRFPVARSGTDHERTPQQAISQWAPVRQGVRSTAIHNVLGSHFSEFSSIRSLRHASIWVSTSRGYSTSSENKDDDESSKPAEVPSEPPTEEDKAAETPPAASEPQNIFTPEDSGETSLVLDSEPESAILMDSGDLNSPIIMDSPMNALIPMQKRLETRPLRPEVIPVVPLTRRPYFPGSQYILPILDNRLAMYLYSKKSQGHGYVGMFLVKEPEVIIAPASASTDGTTVPPPPSPPPKKGRRELHAVGVLAWIERIVPLATQFGQHVPGAHLLVHVVSRIQWTSITESDPIVQVKYLSKETGPSDPAKERALGWEIVDTINELMKQNQNYRESIGMAISSIDKNSAPAVVELARFSHGDGKALQGVLEANTTEEQLVKVLQLFKAELDTVKLQREVEEKAWKNQRRHYLMEQLKQIKRELGLEQDDKENLLAKFRERIATKNVPEAAAKVISEEMTKLSSLEPVSAEFNITRNYLDILTTLPWGVYDKENYEIDHASKVLEEDHHGLKDLKERILEFIAVGQLRGTVHGKILCFVGPPGVGKTSIGKSIAKALGRKFFRFSVGGMSDVAEIKGHRRTYVGAMPGKLLQCLKTVGTSNPVIMMDEIDKLGRGYQGDPASALLEVLDPEQNSSFLDHYLDVPYDLSKVLFICTANQMDTIPAPLLDRMEVMRLSGYVLEEKLAIAKGHLIPHAVKDAGLKKAFARFHDSGLRKLIESYCREAGVRSLQQHIDKICRKIALKFVKQRSKARSLPAGSTPIAIASPEATESAAAASDSVKEAGAEEAEAAHPSSPSPSSASPTPLKRIDITASNLYDFVGKPSFNTDRIYNTTPVGVVMGLAWTAMGGATLYIESISQSGTSSGKGDLKTTGQMGSVMKESTDIAYTFARRYLEKIQPSNTFFETASLHMHIPEGATPKDGPSAGITMVTSLLSLAVGKPARQNLAMTGETTLTGRVLAIGGVKEKTIAAKRSGINTLIFPDSNRKDYEELPDYVKAGFNVHYVSTYDDVYKVAFEPETPAGKKVQHSSRQVKKKPAPAPAPPESADLPLLPTSLPLVASS